jgi:transposase
MAISIQKRWEIVFLSQHRLGPKLSNYAIAMELGIHKNTVAQWVNRYLDTGDVQDIPHEGRKRKSSSKQDKQIVEYADKNDELSSEQIGSKMESKGINLSSRTIRRRLNEHGVYSLSVTSKPLLKDDHKKQRYEWALQNQDRDWSKVLFTDETSVSTFKYKRKVWRRIGQKKIRSSVKHPVKVHVWGCISSQGLGGIHCFTQNLDASKLCRIYEKTMLPSAKKLFGSSNSDWILQEDNDPKHKSKLADQWRKQHSVKRMNWPSQSPDQNYIENVWAVLKANVAKHHCTNLVQLLSAIKKEWKLLSPSLSEKIVESMKRRVQCLIDTNGDHTIY